MRIWTQAIVALLATFALVTAGCMGSDDDGSAGGENATAEGRGEGGTSGILRVGTNDVIVGFNPFEALTVQTGTALQMVYPSLAQFDYTNAEGFEVVPDFAKSWKVSENGRRWTYELESGAKWSDGKPLTADDAAWTINTTVEFQEGPTGGAAPFTDGVSRARAVDATTLVVEYEEPLAIALEQLGQLSILPRHIWEPLAQGNGEQLRTFRPTPSDGLVAGGPYSVKQYEKKGTSIFVPNPDFYGPPSNAEAVAMTFYTNADAMLEDLKSEELDWVEDVPYTAVKAIEGEPGIELVTGPSGLQPDIFFNSNPRKPQNRELLDPRVKEALAMCVNREEIIDVVFDGYAEPVATMVGGLGGEFEHPRIEPAPYDCDEANRRLDELGYRRGTDGIRVAPATSGENAQPEHRMAYEMVRSTDLPFNARRTFEILTEDWRKLGVELTENIAGDETATSEYVQGAEGTECVVEESKGYAKFDVQLSYSVAEVAAVDTLGGETKALWCAWNFTGYDNPAYDRLHERALTTIDGEKQKALVWQLQELYNEDLATVPIAEVQAISAHSTRWTDFAPPTLSQYAKRYFTAPRTGG